LLKQVIADQGTLDTLIDSRDGQSYKTVKIGNQILMAENLNYKAKDSWCFDEDSSNCDQYGRLYSWESANNSCPEGWHLPSEQEWSNLGWYIFREAEANTRWGRRKRKSRDMDRIKGKYLKADFGWGKDEKPANGFDGFGFSGLPAGARYSEAGFNGLGSTGVWWSASENECSERSRSCLSAMRQFLLSDHEFGRRLSPKSDAYSVRCFLGWNPQVNLGYGLTSKKRWITEMLGLGLGTMTDSRDGQSYKTVKIGNQVIMAENLNYKTNESWCYNDDSSNCDKYGRLYAWSSAKNSCPEGWHLPGDQEWVQLAQFVNLQSGVLLKLGHYDKNFGYYLESFGRSGSNVLGFSGLPAGNRDWDGNFYNRGNLGAWWSAPDGSGLKGNYRYVTRSSDVFEDFYDFQNSNAVSVRCFQDSITRKQESSTNSLNIVQGDPEYSSKVAFPVKEADTAKPSQNATVSKGTMIDPRDGKKYKTVKIGNQVIMAENLNYKISDFQCQDKSSSHCEFYSWKSALSVCPEGWHLPTDQEWKQLAYYTAQQSGATEKTGDDYENLGEYLKSTSGWAYNGNGTDHYGFSGLPSDYRSPGGYKFSGTWWSATEKSGSAAWGRHLRFNNDYFQRNFYNKEHKMTVRCFQDSSAPIQEFEPAKPAQKFNVSKGTMIDKRDGKTYKTVKIGKQTLMSENLNYKTYYSWCYDRDSTQCDQYGRLYTWESAMHACPGGWHLPSDWEWEQLAFFTAQQSGATLQSADDYTDLGKYLKSSSGWKISKNGNDLFGFSGLPAGHITSSGRFAGLRSIGHWWSSTEEWSRYLYYSDDDFFRLRPKSGYAYSVRCFQDLE